MIRSRSSVLTALLVIFSTLVMAEEPVVDLTKIDRAIRKQPAYKSTPRYALLVVGRRAEHRAWLVIDGEEAAYVDRNGNGDLTEPGERVALDRAATNKIRLGGSTAYKSMHVFPLGEVGEARLNFQLWVRNPDYDESQDESLRELPEIRAYRKDLRDRDWTNGSLMRAAADGMQCQTSLVLTRQPDDAQVCHLLGPLTFVLKWGERQQLEPWPKRTVFDVNIGSRNLPPRGWTRGGFDFSPLATSEIPAHLHPLATFEFPAASSEGRPLRAELTLDQRCCGDTFYNTLNVPQGVTTGSVKVTVAFPSRLERHVEGAHFEVPINPGRAKYSEAAYVMFHDSKIELKHAVNALRKRGIDLVIQEDVLFVGRDEGQPGISIRLNRGPAAQELARGLAEGTVFAAALRPCDANFEIGPYDAGKTETIQRIEQLLQELTRGFVYQTWDKKLSGPK